MLMDANKIIISNMFDKYLDKEVKNIEEYKIIDEHGETHSTKLQPVESYKVFYLLTNDDSELKCKHQYNLLSNTESIINAIRN